MVCGVNVILISGIGWFEGWSMGKVGSGIWLVEGLFGVACGGGVCGGGSQCGKVLVLPGVGELERLFYSRVHIQQFLVFSSA